jgi:hypothetical protein
MKLRHIGLIAAVMAIAMVGVVLAAPQGADALQLASGLGAVAPSDWMLLGIGMTTLAANKPRPYELGDIQAYPVIAADIIFEGAAVGENAAGYARPLVAGDPFLGFAESIVDNSAGAAGDKLVRVKRRGQVQLAVAGATAITANDGPLVYASDDDTFTLTASTNTIVGRVSRWVESGVCVVAFDCNNPPA